MEGLRTKTDTINIPEYRIRPNRGHFEVVDTFGRIVCTGDTWKETEEDVIDMIKNMVGGGVQLDQSVAS